MPHHVHMCCQCLHLCHILVFRVCVSVFVLLGVVAIFQPDIGAKSCSVS